MPRISPDERAATRRRLIDAGKSEFAERGLAGARFDEISLSAGHAKGTIYNYFDSKEALFFTIVEEWCAVLVNSLTAVDGLTATGQLLEIARLDVAIATKDPDLAAVVINQMPALSRMHRSSAEAAVAPGLEAISKVIATGIAAGEFTSDLDASTLARLFLVTLSGFEQEALSDGGSVGLSDVVTLVDRHFVAGLSS